VNHDESLLNFKFSFQLVFGLSLVILAQGQGYRDSKNAKILQEARYLQGGTHGSAYVQDDGTEFKEETDADGTRKGSYSYIDDTGKKITVQYTAGLLLRGVDLKITWKSTLYFARR